jgi:S-DNA-T family DNA segregation ATPase FtsK/SpoIIIE
VVIVDDPPLDAARLVRLLELGPSTGIYLLWLAPDPAALPGGCRAYLDVAAEDGSTIAMVRTGTLHTPVVCATVADDVARHVARSLAPVIDGGVPGEDESDLPLSIALVTILGAYTVDDPQHIVTRWRENHSIHRRDGKPPTKRERACDLARARRTRGGGPARLGSANARSLYPGRRHNGRRKERVPASLILGMAHSLSRSPDVSLHRLQGRGAACNCRTASG